MFQQNVFTGRKHSGKQSVKAMKAKQSKWTVKSNELWRPTLLHFENCSERQSDGISQFPKICLDHRDITQEGDTEVISPRVRETLLSDLVYPYINLFLPNKYE